MAEDDFFSGDCTYEEAEQYVRKKQAEYVEMRKREARDKHLAAREYPKYGYRYKSKTELVEDKEAADVVREIFQMAADGKNASEIAGILNSRGIEEPVRYWRRLTGKTPAGNKQGWGLDRISWIIHNRIYIGEWRRKLFGGERMLSCPRLISEELFHEANEKFRERRVRKEGNGRIGNSNAFQRNIWDKDTGFSLNMYIHPKENVRIFRFAYPKPEKVLYEKPFLAYSAVEAAVREQLLEEGRKARAVVEALESARGEIAKENLLAKYKEQLRGLFLRQMELECERCERLIAETGDGTDLYGREDGTDGEMIRLDRQMDEIMVKLEEIEKAFSLDNPWVRLYSSMGLPEELTQKDVREWTDGVDVERFERVYIRVKHVGYCSYFPEEWFEEVKQDGKKEQKNESEGQPGFAGKGDGTGNTVPAADGDGGRGLCQAFCI